MTTTPDPALAARLAELPSQWQNTAPGPHHRGKELLPIVYADPGSNGWYYRERKPDSVTAYVRLDAHTAAVQAAVAKVMMMCINRIQKERDDYKASPAPKGEWAEHYDDGLSDALIVISRLDFAAVIPARKGDAL